MCVASGTRSRRRFTFNCGSAAVATGSAVVLALTNTLNHHVVARQPHPDPNYALIASDVTVERFSRGRSPGDLMDAARAPENLLLRNATESKEKRREAESVPRQRHRSDSCFF